MALYCSTRQELSGAHTCCLLYGDARQVELMAIWGALTSIPDTQPPQDSMRILSDAKEALEEIENIDTNDATAQATRKRPSARPTRKVSTANSVETCIHRLDRRKRSGTLHSHGGTRLR